MLSCLCVWILFQNGSSQIYFRVFGSEMEFIFENLLMVLLQWYLTHFSYDPDERGKRLEIWCVQRGLSGSISAILATHFPQVFLFSEL